MREYQGIKRVPQESKFMEMREIRSKKLRENLKLTEGFVKKIDEKKRGNFEKKSDKLRKIRKKSKTRENPKILRIFKN